MSVDVIKPNPILAHAFLDKLCGKDDGNYLISVINEFDNLERDFKFGMDAKKNYNDINGFIAMLKPSVRKNQNYKYYDVSDIKVIQEYIVISDCKDNDDLKQYSPEYKSGDICISNGG